MSLDPELAAMFTQTLRVHKKTLAERNEYGEATYETTPVDLPCHINSRTAEMMTLGNEAILSTGVAYIRVTPWLTSHATAFVPELSSETGWREINIIGIQTRYDEDGPNHMEVFFGEK